MKPQLRYILATLVGLTFAFLLVAAIQRIGHVVYPIPSHIDFTNTEQITAYIQTLPLGALLFVLASYFIATFSGGVIAAFLSKNKPYIFSGIVGVFILLASAANMWFIPHPVWFMALAILGIIFSALFAGKIMSRKNK